MSYHNQQYSRIPSWLDPSTEIRENTTSKSGVIQQPKSNLDIQKDFVVNSFKTLYGFGTLSDKQILEITALMFKFSKSIKENNLSRWQITENYALNYSITHGGKSAPWYSYNGKYFRTFTSIREFYQEWILNFLPTSKQSFIGSKFSEVGSLFWNGLNWLEKYCQVTEQPLDSIQNFHIKKVQTFFAQHVLGISNFDFNKTFVDSLKEFQKSKSLPETTEINNETYKLLLEKWKSKGRK